MRRGMQPSQKCVCGACEKNTFDLREARMHVRRRAADSQYTRTRTRNK